MHSRVVLIADVDCTKQARLCDKQVGSRSLSRATGLPTAACATYVLYKTLYMQAQDAALCRIWFVVCIR